MPTLHRLSARRLPPSLVLVLPLLWALSSPTAQAAGEPRLITVNGEAEVRVPPDEVNITLGLESTDSDLPTAARKNAEQVRQVAALAKSFKIDPKDIGTDQISLDKNVEYVNGKNQFLGYKARRTVSLRFKDLARFEDLLIALLKGGATSIQGVQFCTSQLRKHRDLARAQALKAATEKATALAGGLSQKLGKPHTITENYDGWSVQSGARGALYGNVQNTVASSGSPADDSPAVGLITVSARVSIAFELE
jgi:uncharacterized protein YggE